MKKQIKGAFPCFLAALIWGMSFVVQSTGMEDVGGFTFTGLRMVFAVMVLLPASILTERFSKKPKGTLEEQAKTRRMLWKSGTLCGLCIFAGINLQQFAFGYTGTGKVGFLTALYMIEVAILGTVFLRQKISLAVWLSVILAMGGIFLLCMKPGTSFAIGRGELLSISCSIFFAVQILISDKYAPHVNVISLSCIQFALSGILSLICMALFEHPTLSGIRAALPELLYAGVLSSAGAFTLQLIGQRNTEPVLASMLLCLESVFATLFGWMLLHQSLSVRELLGCAIMFIAIFLTLIPHEFWPRVLHRSVREP